VVEISARPVSQEPMVCFIPMKWRIVIVEHSFQYMIINLGMSENFGFVDLEHLPFPVHMKVDYIRVYQPKGEENIGCEPSDYPTQAYINQYTEAYTNPNLTTWVDDYHQTVPRYTIHAFRCPCGIAEGFLQEQSSRTMLELLAIPHNLSLHPADVYCLCSPDCRLCQAGTGRTVSSQRDDLWHHRHRFPRRPNEIDH